jgi:hypothetical protein
MVSPLANGVFRELQKMLPGLPDKVIHIELKTGVNCPPTVTCTFYASGVVLNETQQKTFDIVERSSDSKPSAPIKKPASAESSPL